MKIDWEEIKRLVRVRRPATVVVIVVVIAVVIAVVVVSDSVVWNLNKMQI